MRFVLLALSTILFISTRAQCPNTVLSATKSEYCISEFIELDASNTSNATTIEWNIGNGWDTAGSVYSTSPTDTGYIDVSLRITLSDGTICTIDSSHFIYVNPLPSPAYSVSKNKLCKGPESIELSDNTPNSAKRTWLVNQNRYVNTPETWALTINKLGGSHLTLIVEDSAGCRNSKVWNNAVLTYNDIELKFEKSSLNNCKPVITNLTSSYTPNGQTTTSYKWTIPGANKTSATTSNVSNLNYTTYGNFYVRLEVSTNRGCTYTVTKGGFVSVGDTAHIDATTSKTDICLSEPVTFTETRQPLPGSFKWDIGSTTQKFASKYQGNFTFRDTGYFDLELTYTHNKCVSTKTKSNFIRVGGQKAIFSSNNAFHCEAPHTVDFVNTSDTISGTISGYQWDIFDSETGSKLTSATSKHLSTTVTKDPSKYDVRLITTSSNGCKDTSLRKEYISIEPYQFNFYASPKLGCVDQEIKYYNRTKSSSYYGLDLFSWDFFNPSKSINLGASAASSPTVKYADTGYFNTQLTAANPLGCKQIKMLDSAVHIIKPNLLVLPEDSILCSVDFIKFVGKSTPTHPLFKHTYIFKHIATGNEVTFSGDSVLASLPEIGHYQLKYHFGTADACSDTLTRNVYANGIEGKIKLDTFTGCSPLTLYPKFDLELNSHLGSSDTTLEYNWDVTPKSGASIYGASSSHPKIVLENDLKYTISLYVSNSTGCGLYTRSDPITLGVKGRIKVERGKCCLGDSVLLENITQNNPNINIWNVLSSKSFNLNKVDSLSRNFIPLDTGSFDIRLIVSKDASCTDTVYTSINVSSLEADFELLDSNLGCAPT
ncbi:MAG: hypothetical protein ACPGTP_01545, partial [Bacteroidia bacterium]